MTRKFDDLEKLYSAFAEKDAAVTAAIVEREAAEIPLNETRAEINKMLGRCSFRLPELPKFTALRGPLAVAAMACLSLGTLSLFLPGMGLVACIVGAAFMVLTWLK